MRTRRWIGALVLATCILSSCGFDPSSEQASTTATSASAATTTSLPPGGRQPTPDDPLRVILAGDSVMADLAPAVIDALGRGGSVEAKFVLAPGVALDATSTVLWRQQLSTFDPEVIVVLVGTWETDGDLGPPGRLGWRARYDREVLDPFVELVTGEGAELIWVGMPAVRDATSTFLLAELNAAYGGLADRHEQVTYVPGGEFVSAPDGGYAEFLEGPDGLERARRVDGLHLCPAGAIRLAEPVIDAIADRWNVPRADDWQTGDWRRPPALLKPEECPPV